MNLLICLIKNPTIVDKDSASLWKNVASLLESLSIRPGVTLVQNYGDSEIGEVVIQLA